MALVLYNTLTRRKETFEPLDPRRVRMYVCGPTVYDFAHIGNARPVVVFDVLYRLLRRLYGEAHVKYVRNITDVDDKINAAAKANGETIRDLTERTARAFHEDMAALLALPPDVEPRATEHIAPMIAMIETLIADGHAYVAEGHVLFSVPSMPDYGRLSGRSLDEMIAGARVEVAPYKRDPQDFVLWKPSRPDEPGWDSPWGRGRPGWHIECSAMSEAHLGETFDIHGGGLDLIFPHHENEIAQSTCAHRGRPFVRYWLHNGFVTVEGEKMSKSLGNFVTVRDLRDHDVAGEAIRLAMLMGHYRDPLDWTRERLRQAYKILDRWYGALREPHRASIDPASSLETSSFVMRALESDINTPDAIHYLNLEVASINKAANADLKSHHQFWARRHAEALGLLQADPEIWFKQPRPPEAWFTRSYVLQPRTKVKSAEPNSVPQALDEDWISQQIERRAAARKARNFAEADRIRNELDAEGVLLEDGPGGTTWRRK